MKHIISLSPGFVIGSSILAARISHVQALSSSAFKTISSSTTASVPTTNKKNIQDIPGPMQWPVVGTLPDFFARSEAGPDSLVEMHQSLYEEFGSVYKLNLRNMEEAYFCDPRDFEVVYRSEGLYPSGGAQEGTAFINYHKEAGNANLLKSLGEGEEWREWRQQMNGDIFRMDAAKSYIPHIAVAVNDASKVADRYCKEDCYGFLSRLAFDMFCAIMFAESLGTADEANARPEDIQFVKDTQEAFAMAGLVILNPLEQTFKSDTYKKFVTSMDSALAFSGNHTLQLVEMISQRQQEQDAAANSNCPVTGEGSVVKGIKTKSKRLLQKARQKVPFQRIFRKSKSSPVPLANTVSPPPACVERLLARGEMPTEEIAEQVGGLLTAGVDTTAYVMGWLFLNLATNPSEQESLYEELSAVLKGGDFYAEAYDKLPYLKGCIRESHRISPPGAAITIKRLRTDMTLGGYDLKAGTRVSLVPSNYNLDPTLVENPQEYRPERWSREEVKKRKNTPAEVIDHRLLGGPFGAGARMCLGARLAEIEIMTAVARLVQDWKISLDPPDQVWKKKQGLFLKADPFPQFKFERRL